MRIGLAGLVLGLVGVAALAQEQPAPPLSSAQLAAFPDGDGREATLRVCTGCHAPEIILQQRLASADWARIVDNMAGRGAMGSDADFDAITAYLSRAFPAG